MGTKVDKSESEWFVSVVVTERRVTWTQDSYDGTRSGFGQKEIEHINQVVVAKDGDEAITKAIQHLNLEISSGTEQYAQRTPDAPPE